MFEFGIRNGEGGSNERRGMKDDGRRTRGEGEKLGSWEAGRLKAER